MGGAGGQTVYTRSFFLLTWGIKVQTSYLQDLTGGVFYFGTGRVGYLTISSVTGTGRDGTGCETILSKLSRYPSRQKSVISSLIFIIGTFIITSAGLVGRVGVIGWVGLESGWPSGNL